ncbi:MAG TPA: hypothetical protein VEC02_02895 [Nitrososphaerales archaeon]|nr:hypothetical protein [Nitrososphaerales archaeon]
MKSAGGLGRAGITLVVVYAALILAFTVIGMAVAPPDAQVGAARPANDIPVHLSELLAFGLLLGAMSAVIGGIRGLPLVILAPMLVVLLDLDHLPAYIGLAQPIRPAHSFVFIAVAVVCTAIVLRRLDLELALLSAFTGHLAVDEGLFAPFSPLSYGYVLLDQYRLPLIACSLAAALLSGYFLRRGNRGGPSR